MANLTPQEQDTINQGSINTANANNAKAGVISTPTIPTTLNSTNTQPSSSFVVPPAPADNNNYSGTVSGGNAVITANNTYMTPNGATVDTSGKVVTPAPTDTSTTGSSIPGVDWLKSYLNIKPPSATDQYNTDYASSGIDAKQTDFNTKQGVLKTAQSKLAGLNAKLAGITAENTAIPLQVQKDFTGTGATTGGVAPITNAQLRDNALKAIPIQAEALVAQAEVASAQGDAQLSQSILQQAQDHLDKLFQIHQTDSTNKYNYQKDLIDKAYQFADKQETKQLNAQKDVLTKNQTDLTDARNFAQSLSTTATGNGQGSVASQLASLIPPDINSKTFQSDLATYNSKVAALQNQIKAKSTTEQISQSTIANVNSQLSSAKGSDGYTDPNLYARLRASSTLSGSDFDNRFAYLVNPASRAKLGLTNAQAGNTPIPGNFTPTQTQSLIGSGVPATQLETIASYISQYGLQAALTNSDMTTAQKNALKAVYGQ